MSWDEYADGWDEDEVVRTYSRAAFESLRGLHEAVDLGTSGRVLDFGCGTGLLTEQLASSVSGIVALDPSTAMIDVLRAKIERNGWTNVVAIASTLEEALAERPEVFEAPFDLIVASSVCGFLDDYPRTVSRLAKLLRKGGSFVQWDWEYDATAEEPYGLTRDAIRAALQPAFSDVVVKTAFEVEMGEQVMKPLMGLGTKA